VPGAVDYYQYSKLDITYDVTWLTGLKGMQLRITLHRIADH